MDQIAIADSMNIERTVGQMRPELLRRSLQNAAKLLEKISTAAFTSRLFWLRYSGAIIRATYQGLLGREPDPDGFKAYKKYLRRSRDLAAFLSDVRRSEEFQMKNVPTTASDMVQAAFRGLLKREANQQGVVFYSKMLAEKKDYAVILSSIVNSQEFRNLSSSALKAAPRAATLKREADSKPGGQLEPQVISSLTELKEMLKMLDNVGAVSDDELRRGFTKFRMNYPTDLPADPDSTEYRERQMKLYEWLRGEPYKVTNEVTKFDISLRADVPFPFATKSTRTVSNQLIAQAHLIRALNINPNGSILEFGPGWGNTTICMARLGFQVTAVDIELNFVQLIKERARRNNLDIDVRQGDFSLLHELDRKFDAVVFFECFHHCSDHQSLIAGLDRVVAPGGIVLFAAEPILPALPIPWGLRLDGESLWAISKHGWMELGFRENYFCDLLNKYGWNVEKFEYDEAGNGAVFRARRFS
jgi:SAM-dependent methyltransferase